MKKLVLVAALAISLVGCGGVSLLPTATPIPQLNTVGQPVLPVPIVLAATPTLVSTSTPAPTGTAIPQPIAQNPAPVNKPCVLDKYSENARFGVQVKVVKSVNGKWEFDPATAGRVPGDTAHPELASDADLSGCPTVAEVDESATKQHFIYVLLPGDTRYLESDKVFRTARGMTVWAYPSNWNIEGFDPSVKASIVAELVTAKRRNQKENGYDWKIVAYLSNGSTAMFEAGQTTPKVDLAVHQSNCKAEAPQKINVAGTFTGGSPPFNASVGAEGCWTVARVDGQVLRWKNAKDNVKYTAISAWLMPSVWTDSQVQAWTPTQ